jgi:hypothetical protein
MPATHQREYPSVRPRSQLFVIRVHQEKREKGILAAQLYSMSSSKLQNLENLDKDELKKAFDISHFDLNAILRGIQLTLVGGKWLQCTQ